MQTIPLDREISIDCPLSRLASFLSIEFVSLINFAYYTETPVSLSITKITKSEKLFRHFHRKSVRKSANIITECPLFTSILTPS